MQLEHTFTVPAGVEQAWQVLLDIERVAPCLPGASLDTVDGDQFTGTVKVRLGPISLTYKGKASFLEKDEAARRVVIDAQGRDSRGNGTASATVTATLQPDGEQATKVAVLTDLNITGKPAQFGRGVLVDVGNKLIGQFADCLAGKLAGTDAATPPEAEAAPAVATPATDEAAPAAGGAAPVADEPMEAVPEAVVPAAAEAAPAVDVAPAAEAVPAPAAAEAAPAVATPGVAPIAEPAALTGGSGPEPASIASPNGPASIASPDGLAAAGSSATGVHGQPTRHARPEVEPIDLLGSAGPALIKRLAPVAVAVLAVVLFVILRRRR